MQNAFHQLYGYDIDKLAELFKGKFSVNAFVEDQGSARMIVVGGFYDYDLEQFCKYDLGVPEDCVENFASEKMRQHKQ